MLIITNTICALEKNFDFITHVQNMVFYPWFHAALLSGLYGRTFVHVSGRPPPSTFDYFKRFIVRIRPWDKRVNRSGIRGRPFSFVEACL